MRLSVPREDELTAQCDGGVTSAALICAVPVGSGWGGRGPQVAEIFFETVGCTYRIWTLPYRLLIPHFSPKTQIRHEDMLLIQIN
jgi:hypothetical protein